MVATPFPGEPLMVKVIEKKGNLFFFLFFLLFVCLFVLWCNRCLVVHGLIAVLTRYPHPYASNSN